MAVFLKVEVLFFLMTAVCLMVTLGTDNGLTHKSETKCFKTVTHYYSNPAVTRKSCFRYTYIDDDFKILSFNLICESNTNVQVDKIEWLLPATMAVYCLEVNKTDFNKCPFNSQCDCCQLPEREAVCSVTNHTSDEVDITACNRKSSCNISVRSKILQNCPDRKYDCDNTKCHSCWARV